MQSAVLFSADLYFQSWLLVTLFGLLWSGRTINMLVYLAMYQYYCPNSFAPSQNSHLPFIYNHSMVNNGTVVSPLKTPYTKKREAENE